MPTSPPAARRSPGARPDSSADTPRRVALVTGASSGIGAATALRLARDGYVVYGAARRVEQMDGLVAASGHALRLDVTDEDSLQSAVRTVLDAHGRIDLLVNSAAYGSYGAVEDVPLDEARRQFDVNLFGLARLVQLVLPTMRAQRSGTIVNVSSIGGKIYTPLGAWYHATKHALEGFSDALRLELAPFGIRVVVVEPGPVESEFEQIAVDGMMAVSGAGPYADYARRAARFIRSSYQGGASQPDEVADVIAAAAAAARPRTRYPVGKSTAFALWSRRLLPDRAFDALLRSRM